MTSTAVEASHRTPADDSELGALAELAAEGFGGAVTRVQELHEAVARRTLAPTGAHDAIASTVYATVRGAGTLLGGALARTARAAGGGPRISDHPTGRLAQGALNGLYGDRLDARDNALAVPMAIRVDGADVAAHDAEALARAFPDATARPVVFVHGLCESDTAWALRATQHGGTYATRVLPLAGGTAVAIRYNTGLHVSENGRRLSALLEDLTRSWPVPVEGLALVGHSMGGLVIRSAAHAAASSGDATWPDHVDTTISLGTPHLGAPLEQATHLAAVALNAIPESRPFGAILAARSVGIKDLRHGRLVDAEWEAIDVDALDRDFVRAEVPLIARARHHVVAATLTERDDHPLARVVGDLLVLTPSAHGLEGSAGRRHVGGLDHFDLLNAPALDDLLLEWLRPAGLARQLSAG
jgi:PGAP1-like protein